MRLHRIAAATHAATPAAAFNGQGGLFGMGRWHTRGRLVVYASQSLSLAALECLVHIQRSHGIQPFVRWEIEIPDDLITGVPVLPPDWQARLEITRAFGDGWLAAGSSAAHLVPSVVISLERNCLLNPAHPDFDLKWVVSGPLPFVFDARLVRPST